MTITITCQKCGASVSGSTLREAELRSEVFHHLHEMRAIGARVPMRAFDLCMTEAMDDSMTVAEAADMLIAIAGLVRAAAMTATRRTRC